MSFAVSFINAKVATTPLSEAPQDAMYVVLSDPHWYPIHEREVAPASMILGPFDAVSIQPQSNSKRNHNYLLDASSGRSLAFQNPRGWRSIWGGPTYRQMTVQYGQPKEER